MSDYLDAIPGAVASIVVAHGEKLWGPTAKSNLSADQEAKLIALTEKLTRTFVQVLGDAHKDRNGDAHKDRNG